MSIPPTADYPVCPACGVDGCVCDWCDDCERIVNPYIHFTEWNPTGGAHLSDNFCRGLAHP